MTNLETYASMLRIIDAAICGIHTESDREGALKAIKRAYNYARKNGVVPLDEAKRSADHRREVIAQWYPGQLPEDEQPLWDGDIELELDHCTSLNQLADQEYERYS